MKKTIRLTESDLVKLIKNVIKEQGEEDIKTGQEINNPSWKETEKERVARLNKQAEWDYLWGNTGVNRGQKSFKPDDKNEPVVSKPKPKTGTELVKEKIPGYFPLWTKGKENKEFSGYHILNDKSKIKKVGEGINKGVKMVNYLGKTQNGEPIGIQYTCKSPEFPNGQMLINFVGKKTINLEVESYDLRHSYFWECPENQE